MGTHTRLSLASLAVATSWVILSCADGPTQPIFDENPDIRSLVVDSAAAALDAAGHFRIDPDVVPGLEGVPIVSAVRARELAAAFTHSYGPAFRPFWERDRGGAIDLAQLTVGPRVYPAQTAFDKVPDIGCHPAFVRLFGSYYLLTLNRGSEPLVRMALSAQTTEFSVDKNGDIVSPPQTGQDFLTEGIPLGGTYIVSPEQAVALAARATGAHVNRVPRLFLRRNNAFSPTFALWRVNLDRAVTVVYTSGESARANTLYVGPNALFYVPTADQSTTASQVCFLADKTLGDMALDTVQVRVVLGQLVDFEAVLARQ